MERYAGATPRPDLLRFNSAAGRYLSSNTVLRAFGNETYHRLLECGLTFSASSSFFAAATSFTLNSCVLVAALLA